jgi:GTP cyclohydrolase I
MREYQINDKKAFLNAIHRFLLYLGEDPDREGLEGTPQRVYDMWSEFIERHDVQETTFLCPDYDEIIIVKDIRFYAFCEHHLLPFFGTVSIGYIPGIRGNIIGLSKFGRIVDRYTLRLTLQEQLTVDIAKHIVNAITPLGVGVVVKARHLCMEMRGVHKPDQITITSAMLGVFRDEADTRSAFLSLIKG